MNRHHLAFPITAILFAAITLGCGGTEFAPGDGGTAGPLDDGSAGSTATTSGAGGSSGTAGGETGGDRGTGTGAGGETGGHGTGGDGAGGDGTGGSGKWDSGVAGSGGAGGSAGGHTGGSGGSGGAPYVDASPHPDGPVDCNAGTVTFHMAAASGTTANYCTGIQCSAAFVTIKTAAGGQSMSLSNGCVTSCGLCLPIACGTACIAPQHLTQAGLALTWTGDYFTSSTCGAGLSCRDQQCAAPGKYIATMCAYASKNDAGAGFCAAESTPTCVDVPFDYPGTQVVEGVLPAY